MNSQTIMLPVFPYGCEALPLTLRKEHRLMMFESRLGTGILGRKKDEVTGG
jgi:hypothetical protein